MKIVYIAGYGRSGSTVLDIGLSRIDDVVGVGELASLVRYIGVKGRCCTCGKDYPSCSYWNSVIAGSIGFNNLKEYEKYRMKMESIYRCFLGTKARAKYKEQTTKLLNSISELSENCVIVDSSKNTYKNLLRPMALSEVQGMEVHMVHLVRPVHEVMRAAKKGTNLELATGVKKRKLNSYRAAIGWVVANLAACHSSTSCKTYIRVYNSELRSDFKGVLSKVAEKSGVSDLYHHEASEERRHMVAGNRLAAGVDKKADMLVVDPSLNAVELALAQMISKLFKW